MKTFHYRRLVAGLALTTLGLMACEEDTIAPLNTPTITATASGQTRIIITITPVTGATSYNIERATGATGGTFAQVGTTTTTTFEDLTVAPNTTYRYRAAAVQGTRTSGFSAEATATTTTLGTAVLSGDITSNRTLSADSVYTISGFVHVANNSTLTIPAGTKLIGDPSPTLLGSSLFILRGSRIVANGTATAPIVFSSGRAAGSRQPGDWGGLIIIGNGIINRSGSVSVEGTGGVTGNTPGTNYTVTYSGGGNNADNSGSLQ